MTEASSTPGRFLTLHGHFYQPPRENPWLEEVEAEAGAAPYHDWNERITAECYAPNADTLKKISFNFGPTLLAWLKKRHPETYAKILEADQISRARRGGHGNAIAQVYHHVIMPLAKRRDKITQVRWGIEDFRHCFGRHPEGMWLPETAMDRETLAVLADAGLRFTILAPRQAQRVRRLKGREINAGEPQGGGPKAGREMVSGREITGGEPKGGGPKAGREMVSGREINDHRWMDVAGERIDPSQAYRYVTAGGRSLALFFYDGPISRAIAFEGALADGETLRARLLAGFSPERTWPQLVHAATDGESYGHHTRFGDVALAAALEKIEREGGVTLTNYDAFLAAHPPSHEVEIVERTSWSCSHGVERWRSDCGCRVGHREWHQRWRAPLREAMDWLRDQLDPFYEARLGMLVKDPWAARDDYIGLILNHARDAKAEFFAKHQRMELDAQRQEKALALLELQRHRLFMYTSDGWFFDDISGLEAVQVLKHAARAIELAGSLGLSGLEEGLTRRLAAAPSNVPEFGDGARVYQRLVLPSAVTGSAHGG